MRIEKVSLLWAYHEASRVGRVPPLLPTKARLPDDLLIPRGKTTRTTLWGNEVEKPRVL
jgi:hypothetical protein